MSSGWHLAHVLFLALWGGVVAAEIVLEILGRRDRQLAPHVAKIHYWIDLSVELPLLIAVVVTGSVLISETRVNALLLVKIAAGLGAVLVNLFCVGCVVVRAKRLAGAGDPKASETTGRVATGWIFRSAMVGVPLALVALWIGARSAGW